MKYIILKKKFYWWNGHPKQTGGPVYLSVLVTVRVNKVEAVGHISPKTENKKKDMNKLVFN